MPTLLLIRHGRTDANANGVLVGRTPGVRLDERGEEQAATLAKRLADLPLACVVASPLERCQQTAEALLAGRDGQTLITDERLTECDYGEWTGKTLKELSEQPLWRVVQSHPSGATFPAGEALRAMQARAVDAVREHDARVSAAGGEAVWAAVSHGDVIKAIVADAVGLHLDQFQRLVVDPASVTVVHYTEGRPYLVRLNDTGADLIAVRPPPADAEVGGGAGAS
jgi:probable phosphomutase (TIGR03848 family)